MTRDQQNAALLELSGMTQRIQVLQRMIQEFVPAEARPLEESTEVEARDVLDTPERIDQTEGAEVAE